jgi:hypothetical protein
MFLNRYLDITDPEALRLLLLLQEQGAEVRVFVTAGSSCHLKAYIFARLSDGEVVEGTAFVGLSNISRQALQEGLEWNYRVVYPADRGFLEARTRFEEIFSHARTVTLSDAWIESYEKRRVPPPRSVAPGSHEQEEPPAPTEVQKAALAALHETRLQGFRRGVVVLATGLGKTWLAAFDAAQVSARRVLFVAHREEILAQAAATFVRIRPRARVGYYMGRSRDAEVDVLCASVQTSCLLGTPVCFEHSAAGRHACRPPLDSPESHRNIARTRLSEFPVDTMRLRALAATRGGQVALAGFEYQRAFAALRLVSMLTGQTVKGTATEIPVWLRYEWAEDIDELGADGKVTLWQCKIGPGWTAPAALAEVLTGFAPKWLWTPPAERRRLQFRLVTSDPAYAAHADLPGVLPGEIKVKAAFLKELGAAPGAKSDRAQWQADADGANHGTLFDALWAATRVLYVPERDATRPQSPWPAEDEALKALALARRLAQNAVPRDALQALRALLGADALAADAQGNVLRAAAEPLGLRPIDVADRLYAFSPPADQVAIPFRLVDSTMLRALRDAAVGDRYVARRPEWADVVRGHDAGIGFFERTLTGCLVDCLRQALSECRKQAGHLRLQWLVGAPGAGKSTLALRAAAMLVSEGACSAIDARFSLPEGDDVDDLVAEWQRLATSGRPLLLLLDDPLGIGSQWPALLRKLSRGHPAIVVLAATPDFLLKKHRHELRDVAPLTDLPLPSPDNAERAELAAMYPGMDQALLAGDDELLVLTMQANAGVSFDDIIRGIWRTLADGKALAADALVDELPWEVAAYWLVVFFHRAYTPCPMPLLQAALVSHSKQGQHIVERMSQLTLDHGWRIFQIDAPRPRYSFEGAAVRSMHARVAQRAWELRPAAHWNVADVIARASVAQPQASRRVGEALVTLHQFDPATAGPVVDAVASTWSGTGQTSLETRYVCDLASALRQGLGSVPANLSRALRLRVRQCDEQSWLAALWLLHASAGRLQALSANLELPYSELIDAADFSLAPKRATKFANALSDDNALQLAFERRLWKAFDGLLDWRLRGTLLTWLLAHGALTDIQQRLEKLRAWLTSNPDDTYVRTKFLGHLDKFSAQDKSKVLEDYRTWLTEHPVDTSVRTKFLGHLDKFSAQDKSKVLEDYRTWLTEHPVDTSVRTKFLGHLDKFSAQDKSKVLEDYRTWLTEHPDDTSVRAKFLAHLSQYAIKASDDDFREAMELLRRSPQATTICSALTGLMRDSGHAGLPERLQIIVTNLPRERGVFTLASTALTDAGSLSLEHLALILLWIEWAAGVLQSNQGDRSAETIVTSMGGLLREAERHAADSRCPAALRIEAAQSISRLEKARDAYKASIGAVGFGWQYFTY